jgi:hypothetical protein
MESKKITRVILRIPLHIFLLGLFSESIFVAITMEEISGWTPVILGVILGMWYAGVAMSKSQLKNNSTQE